MPFAQELFIFISTYGYIAVFFGAMLEGESILLIAGLLAQQEHLSLPLILVCAFLGTLTGDTGWFLAGRYGGERLVRRFVFLQKWMNVSTNAVQKRPRLMSALMRFMYGFRSIVPFSIGMAKVPARTFIFWNLLGASLWITVFGGAGYLIGETFSQFFGSIRRFELLLVVAAILAFAVIKTATDISRKALSTVAEEK